MHQEQRTYQLRREPAKFNEENDELGLAVDGGAVPPGEGGPIGRKFSHCLVKCILKNNCLFL